MLKPTKSKEPNWNKLHPWFKQAHDIIVRNGGEGFAIKAGSPEFNDWMKWFQANVQPVPRFMIEAEKFVGKEVTLPTQWPPGLSQFEREWDRVKRPV